MDINLLSDIFKGKKRHAYYYKSTEMYHKMRVHMDGKFPEDLIGKRRPSEKDEVFQYRQDIYEPITMEPLSKVESSLQKIRKSADWSIRHNADTWMPAISENETPEIYFEKKYPYYGYMGAWVFSEVVRNYIIDANAIIVILPLYIPEDKTEYIKPYPKIVNSDLVFWQSTDMIVLGEEGDDKAFWVFTNEVAARYYKKGNSYDITYTYEHKLGYIPCFKMRGIYLDSDTLNILHRSRFYAMCPRLDEAAREYSDMQAEIVQHIHSESWEIKFPDCKTCKGTGKILKPAGEGVTDCKRCNGSGYDASPYSKLTINANALQTAGGTIPNPPKGYITKDTAIAKLQDERIRQHIYDALSAVNFQFLAQVPQSQSGIAKEVDRDELNNTVHSVAEDLVWIMENIYRISIDMRYNIIVPDAEQRHAMIPMISVPEKYDLLDTSYLLNELKTALDAGASPAIIIELQKEIASKKFYNNPNVKDMVSLIYDLDPLPGYSQDEKMAMEMNGWITKDDAIISAYLPFFVKRAIEEDPTFVLLDKTKQLEKLKQYAAEKQGMQLAKVTVQ